MAAANSRPHTTISPEHDPEAVDHRDEGEAHDLEGAGGEQGRGAAVEQVPDQRGRQAAEDLRSRDDRGHETRHLVGLRVAVELEEVGLERVERVDADPPGEQGLP